MVSDPCGRSGQWGTFIWVRLADAVNNNALIIDMHEYGEVRVASAVADHLQNHVQARWCQPEAGGQLFAKIRSGVWTIQQATGPRPSDIRSRFGFRPDRKAERREIEALFGEGLHYVGDWHTHPQDAPIPSKSDISSMSEIVRLSGHDLAGFLLLIVGRLKFPEGLWASLHLRDGSYRELPVIRSR